ncbi:P-loop containing nucleoside triphosphate hydrolase protein [Lentinula raphanica]|uniref:ATP-dependent DNA helicase n=1 Tax=Lentinula raphanica TaxID=153919 RepID=A0AA38NZJ4_9AGAR|nr:P-loop containing nucleoside triphosphate hydrolase protein [Lentinula raphanica]
MKVSVYCLLLYSRLNPETVSMVDGHLFQQLHDIATTLRKPTPKSFGGIQIIVTGDFFQLPPVTKSNQEPIFAFESPAWASTIENTVNLRHVFRQKSSTLVSALNALRLGAPSDEAITLFNSLSRPLPPSPILPTELYPLRAQVAQSNASRLNALPSPKVPYVARDSGTKPKLLENLLAEERLELKIDAQVMLIKNVDDVLVNGVVGRVLGFYLPQQLVSGTPTTGTSSGLKLGSTNVLPANSKVSSASTSSVKSPTETKKNGALLRYVQLLEDGRTPVSVSDVKNKENQSAVKSEVKTTKKLKQSKEAEESERYPLVLFEYPLQDGGYGSEAVLIKRDEFKVEDAEGKLLARRVQLPLILAWAMSIHKSQGQTIHRVKVDLGRVFEKVTSPSRERRPSKDCKCSVSIPRKLLLTLR